MVLPRRRQQKKIPNFFRKNVVGQSQRERGILAVLCWGPDSELFSVRWGAGHVRGGGPPDTRAGHAHY